MYDFYRKDELRLLVSLWKGYARHTIEGMSAEEAGQQSIKDAIASCPEDTLPDIDICGDFMDDVRTQLKDISDIEI